MAEASEDFRDDLKWSIYIRKFYPTLLFYFKQRHCVIPTENFIVIVYRDGTTIKSAYALYTKDSIAKATPIPDHVHQKYLKIPVADNGTSYSLPFIVGGGSWSLARLNAKQKHPILTKGAHALLNITCDIDPTTKRIQVCVVCLDTTNGTIGFEQVRHDPNLPEIVNMMNAPGTWGMSALKGWFGSGQ